MPPWYDLYHFIERHCSCHFLVQADLCSSSTLQRAVRSLALLVYRVRLSMRQHTHRYSICEYTIHYIDRFLARSDSKQRMKFLTGVQGVLLPKLCFSLETSKVIRRSTGHPLPVSTDFILTIHKAGRWVPLQEILCFQLIIGFTEKMLSKIIDTMLRNHQPIKRPYVRRWTCPYVVRRIGGTVRIQERIFHRSQAMGFMIQARMVRTELVALIVTYAMRNTLCSEPRCIV